MSQRNASDYRLELEASFLFTIETTIEGSPRLNRTQLEELIDENWWWISADTDVLLESHWELVSFGERRKERTRVLAEEGSAAHRARPTLR